VSQQELNLFQFTTCLMAKTGTGPPEVVWREKWNLTAPSFLLHDTPNDLRTEAGSPDSASFIDLIEAKRRP
jgi:hypothetical protein